VSSDRNVKRLLATQTVVASIVAFIIMRGVVSVSANDGGQGWMDGRVEEYNELRGRIPAAELALRIVDESVDLERFSERVWKNYVGAALAEFEEHLGADEHRHLFDVTRERMLSALRQRLIDDLTENLARVGILSVVEARFDNGRGTVALQAEAVGGSTLEVRLHQRQDVAWRIEDIAFDGEALSRRYHEQFRETIDGRYSPAVLESRLRQLDYIVLEDFSSSRDGELPFGWRWRDRDEGRHKPYQVRSSNNRTYLAAEDSGGSVLLLRFAHWNPRDYPIMTWCWRADSLPTGGDERFGDTNDSAAGIYVFFSQTWIGMPRHIKYVWSSMLPEGTIGRRDRIARPYFVVVESGDRQLGEWLFANVDLEKHYDHTWGGRPKNRTQGLGLLTDANSTDSKARAFYADLRVWTREAYEAGRIEDYCACYREPEMMTEDDARSATVGAPPSSEMTP